jgi:glycosyltransferase involved in cell wall biosynthesis
MMKIAPGVQGPFCRMRIAIFSECYAPVTNGVVTSIISLRETLRAWGHTVYVFAPGKPQPEDDADLFRLPELPFPRHPYHFARPFPTLNVDFASLNVEVVHCQHPFTVGRLGAEQARRYGLPMVYTAHSLYDLMASTSKSPLVRRMGQPYARGVIRRFCARADYVIAPTHHTVQALWADGVRARFAVVPSGIRPLPFDAGARERIRARLHVPDGAPLLLCLGRLGPEKRVDLLLRAVAILKARELPAPQRDFRVVIVGDGMCRGDLEILATDLGVLDRVEFVGEQPHATAGDWYAAADLFMLTAPAETQGLVLVEAMAAGLPCVAVAHGGPLEIVNHGDTGLLVEFDSEAFADGVQQLLLDTAESRRMGENGRRHARDYTPEAMAKGVLDVYERVLKIPHIPVAERRVKRLTAELTRLGHRNRARRLR